MAARAALLPGGREGSQKLRSTGEHAGHVNPRPLPMIRIFHPAHARLDRIAVQALNGCSCSPSPSCTTGQQLDDSPKDVAASALWNSGAEKEARRTKSRRSLEHV